MSGALREVLARFGITADTRQLDRADRRVSSTTRSLRGLVAAAGGAATLIAMRRFVGSAVAMGDDLDKTAQQIGLTTRELQAFSHAAQLSGVDSAGFANAMGQLQKNARDAAAGVGEYTDSFEALGIQSADLLGSDGQLLGGADILRLVADGMQNTTNTTERTALAMEIMGRSGRRMLPMLTSGREGLAAMEAELAQLGGGASEEFIRQSVQMTDELTRMRLSTTSLKSTLLTSFLPTMTRVVTWMTRTSVALSETGAAAAAARPILVALGVAAAGAAIQMGIAWGATVAPVLLAALAATLLYLAIDDVVVAVGGGDSVLEEFINSLGYLIDMPRLGTNSLQSMRDAWGGYFDLLAAGRQPMDALGTTMSMLWNTAEHGQGAGLVVVSTILGWVAAIQQLITTVTEAHAVVSSFFGLAASSMHGGVEIGGAARTRVQEVGGSFLRSVPGLGGLGDRLFGTREAVNPAGAEAARTRAEQARAFGSPGNYTATPIRPASNVQIAGSTTSIVVNAAENPQATARIVGQELDRREAANNRAVLAAVEPSGAT